MLPICSGPQSTSGMLRTTSKVGRGAVGCARCLAGRWCPTTTRFTQGDRVGIVLPTHADFYRAFFGVILAGGIPAALYPPVRLGKMAVWKAQTAAMLQAIACSAVLTDARLYGLLGQPARKRRYVWAVSQCRSCCVRQHTAPMLRPTARIWRWCSSVLAPPTSRPIALTHANILGNAQAILTSLPGICPSIAVSVGCCIRTWDSSAVQRHLAPAPLTLIRPEQFVARPRVWLEALTQSRATISCRTNFAFSVCTERVRDEDRPASICLTGRLPFAVPKLSIHKRSRPSPSALRRWVLPGGL